MIKPDFCLRENKGVDQLFSNCTADQRLYFRYTDSTCYSVTRNFKLLAIFCDRTDQFMSDMVKNSEDWLSLVQTRFFCLSTQQCFLSVYTMMSHFIGSSLVI